MTNTLIAIRFIRSSLAASLLGAALLVGAAQAGSAAEITAIQVSAPIFVPVSQDAGPGRPGTTPAATTPAQSTIPAVGAVGFGWG